MSRHRSPTIEDLIQKRLKQNMSYQEIITDLHVSPKRISRINKLLQLSNASIQPLPIGRPTIISPPIIENVDKMTLSFPKLGGKILAKCITEKLGLSISKSTINRIRDSLHFRFQAPRKQPFLTEQHMAKRVAFSKTQLNGPIDWSEKVVLSDESRFGLQNDSQHIWVKRGIYNKESFRQKRKVEKSIMVWGAISKGWRSPLVIITGNLNSQGYIDLLQENKIFQQLDDHFGHKQYFFEQDGAPPHRSQLSVKWIEEHANLISEWPPNSPDLTGIENIWAIMKQRLSTYNIQSIPELKEHLQREWWSIPQSTIDSIIASTPQRFQLAINQNGRSIGHLLHRASAKKFQQVAISEEVLIDNDEVQCIDDNDDCMCADDVEPNEAVSVLEPLSPIKEILMIQPCSHPPRAFVQYNGRNTNPEWILIDRLKKIAPEQYIKYLESRIIIE
jgi:hypothetical protein